MGVAAHDARDYDFAIKYNLPIKQVLTAKTEAKQNFHSVNMANLLILLNLVA